MQDRYASAYTFHPTRLEVDAGINPISDFGAAYGSGASIICVRTWVDRSAEHLAGQRFMQISGTSCARGIAAYLLFLSSSSHEEIFFSRLSISARISARGLVLPAKNWTMASG